MTGTCVGLVNVAVGCRLPDRADSSGALQVGGSEEAFLASQQVGRRGMSVFEWFRWTRHGMAVSLIWPMSFWLAEILNWEQPHWGKNSYSSFTHSIFQNARGPTFFHGVKRTSFF